MIDPKSIPSFRLDDGNMIPCIGMGTFGSDRVTPDEVVELTPNEDGIIETDSQLQAALYFLKN